MNRPDWMGSVLRDTHKPVLVALAIAFGAAWAGHAHNLNSTKSPDIFG